MGTSPTLPRFLSPVRHQSFIRTFEAARICRYRGAPSLYTNTRRAAAEIAGLFYLVQALHQGRPALLSAEVVSSKLGGMARRGACAAMVVSPHQPLKKQPASLHAALLHSARPAPPPIATAVRKKQSNIIYTVKRCFGTPANIQDNNNGRD